jgi:serine/threonine protein kinase
MVGKTLGHYQITSQLGKGGMGEVYQAKDSKLGRDVAIKVLPEEFAKDSDRVARFQREAKVLASLNHPNIAAIYGLEESGGTNFLVLELVDGDTLADRIAAGPISIEEALKLALQIAEALDAAHEKGVIHRDLKPANIKVTPDGKVKVLDFGLAKAFAGEQADLNLTNSPTLSIAATQQGIILGTAAYMSPEQARGKAVDKRTDIWAFGCVLYEMLTGQAAFQGEDVTEILAAVVKSGADFDLLPSDLHPRVREAIVRCLQKDLKRRYSSINDARYELEQSLMDPGGPHVHTMSALGPRRKLRTILPWAAGTLVLGLIIAGVAVWNLRMPEPPQVMRFEYDLPEGQQFSTLHSSPSPPFAVSPDGGEFAYSTQKGLYLRSMDELTAKLLPGTEGRVEQPFFSPDGKWIGYFSQDDGKLKKISINGGTPVVLSASFVRLFGATWCEDNTIVYGQVGGDIMQIPASGGTPKSIVQRKSATNVLLNPQILPGMKAVLYASGPSPTESKIMVQSLKSGETKELFPGIKATYLPTGHIFYVVPDGTVFVVPFDIDNLAVKGERVPVLEGITEAAISYSGTFIYIPGGTVPVPEGLALVWVDRQGKEEPLSAEPGVYRAFRISPDGKSVALAIGLNNKAGIYILDLDRETRIRLTFEEESTNLNPIWTLDGKRIIYNSSHGFASGDIYWKASDGTGDAEKLASSPGLVANFLSKDGKTLVTTAGTASSQYVCLGTLSMEGDHAWKPLLQEKHSELCARISPDGRWMAYESNESGKFEIYVRPFPDVNKGKWLVSTSGGDTPLWSPDGRELFYRNDDATMTVPVETQPTFKPGKPALLFRGKYRVVRSPLSALTYWDISPDGKRFLMLKEALYNNKTGETPNKIIVAVNGLEELNQRVPAK